ncbi:MAG: response regulator [Planctomycetota bacterium]|jgi:CheY-like chemotaxis protein|nr:response regulator [Planctomycetota bacterium]MDP7249242.1 response regulator [Planctomycetota bacterium]
MPGKILVLDDDADVAKLIQTVLESDDYEVVSAPSAPRAMTLVRNEDISLIIADIMMPIVDGYQFCSWLRNRPDSADVPIIVLTAHEERYGREKSEELNVNYFFNKPFEPEDFLRAVKDCVGQQV